MQDVAPDLLAKIEADFKRKFDSSATIKRIQALIAESKATHADSNDFAVEAGKLLAESYKANLSSAVLPDGKMYYNIAERILRPTLGNNYELISTAAAQIQTDLNHAAGLGMKGQKAALNQDRIDGIVNRISKGESYDDIAWILDDPVVNFSQSVVDDTVKANAEFHAKAGLRPKIIRTLGGDGCAWCKQLAGTYNYPDVPQDVYRRHENCKCSVTYVPNKKSTHSVWPKGSGDQAYQKGAIQKETQAEKQKLIDTIANHPGRIVSTDPDVLRSRLKSQKIRTFDLKNGGFSADLGGDKKLRYENGAYAIFTNGKKTWSGEKLS